MQQFSWQSAPFNGRNLPKIEEDRPPNWPNPGVHQDQMAAAQRSSLRPDIPEDACLGSSGRTSRLKSFDQAFQTLDKQAFEVGDPEADVYNPTVVGVSRGNTIRGNRTESL